MVSDAELGRWLRRYRTAAGFSQLQVAQIIGCPRPAVSLIESGQRRLTAVEFLALLGARPQTRGRSHDDSQPTQGTASNDALGDADELARIISRRSIPVRSRVAA